VIDRPRQFAQSIVGRAMGAFAQYRDGLIFAITPPAVQELGNATGFDPAGRHRRHRP
jgi:HAE1 family hydrophobic/amphiphilic exporter-1/multidrug efflux pump